VAQALSWWHQRLNGIPISSQRQFQSRSLKSLSNQSFGKLVVWLLSLVLAIAMLCWHWKLVLATSLGVLVMWLVYRLQALNWQVCWSNLRRFFQGANRQLAIAVGSGSLASLSIYMALSIGIDTDSPWIGVAAMLQGLGTLSILVLLIYHMIGRQENQEDAQLEALLVELTHTEPLKRLIAVRQLARLGTKARFDKTEQRSIADYFRLMLSRESEPIVRDAIIECLQALENVKSLNQGASAFSMPESVKRSTTKIHRRIS
jgi:hypothetical protein